MHPEQQRLIQSFVASSVEKPSTSLEMDDESALLRGEEKCQYSNAFDYIMLFVVLNNRIIGNPLFPFGITNIFRSVVKTNVRSKIISWHSTAQHAESKDTKLDKDPSQLLENYRTVTK